MKKYIIFSLLFVNLGFGQNSEFPSSTLTNYALAAPTVSSLMNFGEIPVNEFTGIPNIQENIFSTKTLSSLIDFNVSYAYHPKGINLLQKSSDLGTGWSLNCGGSISRMVMFRPEVGNQNYQNSSYADTYYFNFMGFNGSFQIKYDQNNVNPELIVKRTDTSNLKIEFIKDPNSNKIDSFTIYDMKGIKYVFSVFDINVSTFKMFTPSNALTIGSHNNSKLAYRSSWHLKEVIDNNNKKIIDFSYQTYIRVDNNNTIPLTYQTQKLKNVNVLGYCNIALTHTYSPNIDEINSSYHCDSYNLNSIVVFDSYNNIIKKIIPTSEYINFPIYKRDITYPASLYSDTKFRRYLKKISELDKYNQILKETHFSYKLNFSDNLFMDSSGYLDSKKSCFIKNPDYYNPQGVPDDLFNDFEFALSNKNSSCLGILEAISYSTGGGYEFVFETNTFSGTIKGQFSDISFSVLNDDNKKIDLLHDLNYNTANQNYVNFNLLNSNNQYKKYYFNFENEGINVPIEIEGGGDFNEVEYKFIDDSCNDFAATGFIDYFSDNILGGIFNLGEDCLGKSMYLGPCPYRINIYPYMGIHTKGKIKIYVENYNSNLKKYVYGGGNRIKEIKKYEQLSISNTLIKNNLISSTLFEYNKFDDNSISSGELSYGSLMNSRYGNMFGSDYQVNYKNVKKILNNGIGYTKTTFKTPTVSTIGYYSIKDGLPELVQTFDKNNNLLIENEYNYDIVQDQNLQYILDWHNTNINWFQTFVKERGIKTKNYFFPNGSTTPNIVETSETYAYNPINKKISESTVSNSRGETLTTKYFYHTGNSIHSQNRISEIERIETYRASELLSKSQIVYNNNWTSNVSFLPQTIQTAKGSEGYENRLHYLNYDEFGNPIEVKQEEGIHICYIWGYNKTQPIAKIENATYAQVQPHVANLQTLSNGNNEQNLITALNNLRTALPNAMITTYTYKSLVGISTVTDPKGDKQTYHYDSFNRLQFVKDAQGNILSENQYHYRTQN